VCYNLENILAVELLCAAQAFDFHRPLKSSNVLERVHQLIRTKISHATKDRLFGEDIEKALKIIKSKTLLEIADGKSNTLKSEHNQLFENF